MGDAAKGRKGESACAILGRWVNARRDAIAGVDWLWARVRRWDRLGRRSGVALRGYGENRIPLRTCPRRSGASPHQIRLRPRLNQRLLLLDELLPVLSVFGFVAVVLEVGHFAA